MKGRVELRPTSPKWAWVEYRLAQGGFAAGHAAAAVARAGGGFAAWRKALADVPEPATLTTETDGGPAAASDGTGPTARRRLPLAAAS